MAGTDQPSAVLSAPADPTRRGDPRRAGGARRNGHRAQRPLPMSMPALSRHLKVLEHAALSSQTRSASRVPAPSRPPCFATRPTGSLASGASGTRPWTVSTPTSRGSRPPSAPTPGSIDARRNATARFSRGFDAPPAFVFGDFTDQDRLATWSGPRGSSLPRDEIELDPRPGGFERWTGVAAAEPDGRTRLQIRLGLPAHLAGPSSQGRLEAFERLGAILLHPGAAVDDIEV